MADQPNILFIFTDQQRADTLACYGNTQVNAPNLNSLAERSFVVENAYVSQPICTPSRSSIMTGLYPHANGCVRNNIPLDPSAPTIAELLPDDYLTAYYGKWHLGNEVIRQHGFKRWLSMEDQYRKYYTEERHLDHLSDYHHFLVKNGFQPDVEDNGKMTFSREMTVGLDEQWTKASFLADRASEFIHESADRPFALYVNFLEPHPPYSGPLDDLHDPSDVTFGPAFLKSPADDCSALHRSREQDFRRQFQGRNKDEIEAEMRNTKARYWGNVTLVDRAIGKILEALKQAGVDGKTIVCFTSEHGDQIGEHNILQKAVLYEESAKVPMLIHVPWLTQDSRRIEGRFSHVDLVPTLLDLVGEAPPPHLHGESRAPVLRGETTLSENDVIVEWNGRNYEPHPDGDEMTNAQNTPHRSIIGADGWKLNLSVGDKCEMYDLNSDPHELNNLFGRSENAERVRSMTGRVRDWQRRTGDTVSLPAL